MTAALASVECATVMNGIGAAASAVPLSWKPMTVE